MVIPENEWVDVTARRGESMWQTATRVGDVIVSTIGGMPDPYNIGEFMDIGWQRKYETMVFPTTGDTMDDVTSWLELHLVGYNTYDEAVAGHRKVCLQFAGLEGKE